MDDRLKREIILEHYQNPYHKGLVDNEEYIKVNSRNASCVDNIDVMALVDNNVIIDIRFDGEACAICTSAASIMIKTLIGKNIDEAKDIIDNYNKMIDEKEYDYDKLEELNVYDTVYKQPNRKNCALLPMKAMLKIVEKL